MASALLHAIITGVEISNFINNWKTNLKKYQKTLTFNSNLNNDHELYNKMYWDDYGQRH
tara:strand:+ start:808 stop:984 length:177 start_codon:yes stop_codon:yes gene_type:complete